MQPSSQSLIAAAVLSTATLVTSCGERYTGPFRDPNAIVIPSFADSAFGAGGSKWFASRTFDSIAGANVDAQSLYSVEVSVATGAKLVALNLTNGAQRWTQAVPASGAVVIVSGTASAVSSSVATFDALTGVAKFTYQPATARFVTSNGATDGTHIIVGNASGEVLALHPGTGAEVWKLLVDTAPVRGVAASGGTVFAGGNGFLAAVTAATGALKWKRVTTDTPRPYGVSGPAVDSGRVTVMTYSAPTYGMANYDATTGALKWSVSGSVPTSGTEVPGQPACDGKVTTNSASAISALDATTGQAVWSRSLGTVGTLSSSCAFGNVITNALSGILGAQRNEVMVLRASDGALLAQYPKAAGQQLRVYRVLRTGTTLYFLTDRGVTAVSAP